MNEQIQKIYTATWRLIHSLEDRKKDEPVPAADELAERLGLRGRFREASPPPEHVRESATESVGEGSQLNTTTTVRASLKSISSAVAACKKCELHKNRIQTVSGSGVDSPLVLCIGEGPGEAEDNMGQPFVGPAGQYLDKWLHAIGLSRQQNVYLTNIIKCRTPENRDPSEKEIAECFPWLVQQIESINPPVIVTLGRFALSALLGKSVRIGRERGTWTQFEGIPVLPMYHPSAVLRNQQLKRDVWSDLQSLRAWIDNEYPGFLPPMANRT